MDEASLLSRCYSGLATMLGCDAEEIAVVQSATIAWQAVCYGIPFKPGDKILTSMAEYGSNYIGFLQICKRTGAEVSPNPPQPSPNSFESNQPPQNSQTYMRQSREDAPTPPTVTIARTESGAP
eukprot:1180916-Prorocentrum_minimum.AAC.1